jgi:putative transposase
LEEEIRIEVIRRYLTGEKPKSIYRNLKRSKKWFFKWLKRYQNGGDDWYKDQFRAPINRPNEIKEEERQRIISIRKKLESEPYAQGVSAIKWELKKLGLSFPSDMTINRILKQEGLVKKTSYIPKGVEYPYFTEALDFNNIHQADLVGPRYIKGDGRFYSLNVMDLFSHRVYIESQRTKEDKQVAASLMRCWKAIGIPDFLQFDNELSFHGSNKYPRSLGIVLRVCLHYGIQPVFIPIREPWRNGAIEHFNDTYNKKFS